MAAVKFAVSSYSSQDPKYPASNIQKTSAGWLCNGSDVKRGRAEVTLRLDQRCSLSHIDIGNNGSFSIEVQVARCGDENFYSLISATTFMSANDSRSATNKFAVRMFKAENFDETNRLETWDRMRIICTQPFRKDKPFGVSMLKLRAETDLDAINNNSSPIRSRLDKLAAEKDDTASPGRSSSSKENWFKGAMQGRLHQIVKSGQTSQNNDRSMRMVMAAVKTPTHKTQLVQQLMEKKSSPSNTQPTFMGSVRTFFRGLDLTNIDPYSMKVSELRHQFEKAKCRKLTSDEKKLFKGYALEFFDNHVNGNQKPSSHVEARVPVKKPTPAQVKVMEIAKQLSKDLNTDSNNSPQIKFRKLSSTSTGPEPEVLSQNSDSEISEISTPGTPLHSRLDGGTTRVPVSSMSHGTTPKSLAVVNDLTDLKSYDATPKRPVATAGVTTPKTPVAINKVMTPKTPVQGITTPKYNKQVPSPPSAMFRTPSKPRTGASTAVTVETSSPRTAATASLTAAAHNITRANIPLNKSNRSALSLTPTQAKPTSASASPATPKSVTYTTASHAHSLFKLSSGTTTTTTPQVKPNDISTTPKGKATPSSVNAGLKTNTDITIPGPNGPVVLHIINPTNRNINITKEDLEKAMQNVRGDWAARVIKPPAHFKDFVTNGQVVANRSATPERPKTPNGNVNSGSTTVKTVTLSTKTPSTPQACQTIQSKTISAKPGVTALKKSAAMKQPVSTPPRPILPQNTKSAAANIVKVNAANTATAAPRVSLAASSLSASVSTQLTAKTAALSTNYGRSSSTPLKSLPRFSKPSPSLPSPIPSATPFRGTPATTPLRGATSTTPKSLKLIPASQRRAPTPSTPTAPRSTALPPTPKSTAIPLNTPQTPELPLTSSQPRRNINSTAVTPSQHCSNSLRTEVRPSVGNLKKRSIAELLSDDEDDLMLPPLKKTQTSNGTPAAYNQPTAGASFSQSVGGASFSQPVGGVSFNQSVGGVSFSQTPASTQSQSRLTLQDLLSSDEEDDLPALRAGNSGVPHKPVSSQPLYSATTRVPSQPSTYSSQSPVMNQSFTHTAAAVSGHSSGVPVSNPSVRRGAIFSGASSSTPDVIVSSDDDDDDLPEINLDSDDEGNPTRSTSGVGGKQYATPNSPTYYQPHQSYNTSYSSQTVGSRYIQPHGSGYMQPQSNSAAALGSATDAVQCPICFKYFLSHMIEAHASDCIIE